MNWQKISEKSPRAFSEFQLEGNYKCSEDDFISIVQEHGEKLMGLSSEDLYEFFDTRGIYVQVRITENVFQWRINNSGWSTESFQCRKSAETKGFSVAFGEREKQWDKII